MNEVSRKKQPDFEGLPNITFRQLEVFRVVCKEKSYANAALELRSTRANVKRVCDDFEKAVGRPLFQEGPNRSLEPASFAQGLLGQISPLSRSLRRLGESVRHLHEEGRILRFAAAGEFFKGGLFTDFLGRLQISDAFRPCFLRIETKRFRTALLNAECDVYFGVGISASDRLDLVNLGPIPWQIRIGKKFHGKPPAKPADLAAGKWRLSDAGENEASARLLDAFHAAGAKGGGILTDSSGDSPADDEVVFIHDTTGKHAGDGNWPCYQFSAVLRKHHPYSELLPRLTGAAIS
ncbi:MAG: LysR family transcriptional regulator [Luteolibacter sp.]|uniref:LysR family transcriptional regulator n=1 Tax=Luteolibacter sp. TaxID=1962973 RepID=UPI003267AF32